MRIRIKQKATKIRHETQNSIRRETHFDTPLQKGRGEADFVNMIQCIEHLQTLVQAELDLYAQDTINHTLGRDLSCSLATCCHNSDNERTHICGPQQAYRIQFQNAKSVRRQDQVHSSND